MKKYPVIRNQAFEIKDGQVSYLLWIEENWASFTSISIDPNQRLRLELGNWVCIRCHKIGSNFRNYCNQCEKEMENRRIRENCLFGKMGDLFYAACSKEQPSCGIPENANFCFQTYILYIARLGNFVKVGITRKNRKGKYISRLIEQGMNEAIIVDHFNSLAEVAMEERWMKNIGISDKITRNEKSISLDTSVDSEYGDCNYDNCESLFKGHHMSELAGIWTQKLMRERYVDKKLLHLSLFPKYQNMKIELLESISTLYGTVQAVIGNLLVYSQGSRYLGLVLSEIMNREVMGGVKYDSSCFN